MTVSFLLMPLCLKTSFVYEYTPNSVTERELFFAHLLPIIECDKNVIVFSGFTCVYYVSYRSRVDAPSDRSVRVLEERIQNSCLVDVGYLKVSPQKIMVVYFQGT